MTQRYSGNYQNKAFRYVSLALIAGCFFCLQTNAQQRSSERQSNRHERSFSPNTSREQRMEPSSQRQADRVTDRSNNRWAHDIGRHEQRAMPRPVQRELQVNNTVTNNRTVNSYSNNSRFGNNRYYPSGYHRYNYGSGWGNRRPIYSPSNPGWRYSYLPGRNSIITSFLFPYETINFGGCGYRYYEGVYYRPYNNVFRVVAPPFGFFINTLPYGYSNIYVNNYPYYYYNGTYYDQYEDSYRVVAPPIGAVVESIPQGYETLVIDGETYYKVDNVQYKPVVQDNGEIWYQVIKVD